jgi:transcriptional regulator with XRE-family HTH domain
MYEINPSQVKAARALLGWSQGDLAERAKVSRSTIRILEDDKATSKAAIRIGTLLDIQKALEAGGIEFLENEGIRRVTDGVKIFKGPKSCEMFLDDILQTIKEKGGDIFAIVTSQGIMTRLSVITKSHNLERLESVRQSSKIKWLFPNTPAPAFAMPPFQFRKPHENSSGPSCYFVYGDKRADISLDGNKKPVFVVYSGTASMAPEYRKHLLSLWENALPHQIPTSARKQHSANNA